jgi:hypothetical protein
MCILNVSKITLGSCDLVNIPQKRGGLLVNIPQSLFLLHAVADVVAWYAQEAGSLRNVSISLLNGGLDQPKDFLFQVKPIFGESEVRIEPIVRILCLCSIWFHGT